MARVEVYGADWCEDTQHARQYLNNLGVHYDYIDIEQNKSAAEWVKQQNEGKERKPTIKVDGQVLTVPSDQELEDALRRQRVLRQ